MSSKNTDFRVWLNRKWMEYQDELFEIDGSSSLTSPGDYFHHYRWWLKSRYKLEKQDTSK
jgi:hypothetical protein